MRRMLIVALAGLTAVAGAFTPKEMRFGTIDDFALLETVELEWNETDYGPRPALGEGEMFAVVTVQLDSGRSIGKYDYIMNGEPCLAMASGEAPFKPDVWEFTRETTTEPVKLLYKVLEDGAPYTLLLDYPEMTWVTGNSRQVNLSLVEEEPEPVEGEGDEAEAGEAGEEGELAGLEGDGEAAAEGEPAAEDGAEPAAEEKPAEEEKPAAAEAAPAEAAEPAEAKPEPAKEAAPAKMAEPKEEPKPEKKPEPKEEEPVNELDEWF